MSFDITKIEGYKEDMTAEEKLALLSGYKAPEPDYSGYVKKEVLDAKAKEAAELSRQLKARMTEDEQKEAERLAEAEKIQLELDSLRRDKTISETKAKYLGLGYDEKLASETAIALADGNMEKVFANQAIHIENVKKIATAKSLADDPKPPAGSGDTGEITKERFKKMSLLDKQKLASSDPTAYQKFYTEE